MRRNDRPWPDDFGPRLRRRRLRRRFTQDELALACGIDRTHLSNLERGKTMPSVPLLMQLALALGASTDYLLGMGGARRTREAA